MLKHDVDPNKSTTGRTVTLRRAIGGMCRIAPALAERVAQRLFVTPGPTRRPPRETEWADAASRSVMRTDAGNLVTWTWGQGSRTVLLVHGWAARGLQLGAFAAPLVNRGFRVVAYDAPGHGESPGSTSSLIEISRAVGAMACTLGGVDAVIAHSLGATAMVLAAGRAELSAGRLVALAPSASLAAIMDRFSTMIGLTPDVTDRLRRRLALRFHFDWAASEPLAIAPRMRVPLLVVHDSDDRFVPPSEGAELAATWPGAELVTTSGLGHHRLLRDPETISRSVDFVSDVLNLGATAHADADERLTA